MSAVASPRHEAQIIVMTMSTGRTVRLLVLSAGLTETSARLIMCQAASSPDQADALTLSGGGPWLRTGATGDELWVDYRDEFWGPDPVTTISERVETVHSIGNKPVADVRDTADGQETGRSG